MSGINTTCPACGKVDADHVGGGPMARVYGVSSSMIASTVAGLFGKADLARSLAVRGVYEDLTRNLDGSDRPPRFRCRSCHHTWTTETAAWPVTEAVAE